jgi:single stranded DNA-binding protein (ssb)
MNSVNLIGRIGKDIQLRKTQSNKSVVNFPLAVTRKFNKEETDWINIIAWERTADYVSQYGKKGALIGVMGSIQTRTYDDASGKKVYVTEVVCDSVQLLESKRDNDKALEEVSMDYVIEEAPTLDISSDELPF